MASVAPPCGPDCLRQRKLDALKLAMDTAEKNKDQNPVAYSEARINYYTLLKGQGWLVAEKQKVAQEEIEPVLGRYSSAYKALETKDKSQYQFKNLASAVKSHEEDNNLLTKEVQKVHDKTNVIKRNVELSSTKVSSSTTPYLGWIIDGIIAVLGLVIVYMLYRWFTKPVAFNPVQDIVQGFDQGINSL